MNKFTKQLLLTIATFFSFLANGQNLITPITVNLPANPPANTADWASAVPPVMIIAQTKLQNGQVNGMVQESKILVTIKSGGSKICGTYTPQTAPTSGFNSATKNWSGAAVTTLLGQECILKPGSYELCVQFYSLGGGAVQSRILGETCRPFTIKGNDKETFSPPTNVSPVKDKVLTEKEAKAPITFRWTPIVPKPKDPVTYKLRVWQVEEGQAPAQAMKANTPILEKEVKNITQSVDKITFPPVYFKYIWNVEASKQNQMGEVEMLGSSEPTSFSVSSGGCIMDYTPCKIDSIICKSNNQYKVCATFNVTKSGFGASSTSYTAYSTKIIQAQFFDQSFNPVGTVIPINILKNEGQSYTLCQTLTIPASVTTLKIKFDAQVQTANLAFDNCVGSANAEVLVPSCRCDLCDSNVVKWTLPTQINYNTNQTNNIASLSGPLSFGPYPIVKLSAEIVDFYWYTEGDCKKCNTNDYYFGNLVGGSIGGMTGGTSVAGPGGTPIPTSHQLDFISPTLSGITLNNAFNLNISLPPQTQLSCCTDCFRFCIRYTATFMQNGVCKTCSIVKCYETKRVHKKVGLQMFPPLNDCGERGVIIVKDKTGIKEN